MAVGMTPERSRLKPGWTPAVRHILFSLAEAAVALGLWLGPLSGKGPALEREAVPWWFVLALVFLLNVFYVELRHYRDRLRLSLDHIPLAIGLFALDPRVLLLCYVGGFTPALWIRGTGPTSRRLRIAFFNAANNALILGLEVWLFRLVPVSANDPLNAVNVAVLIGSLALTTGLVGALLFALVNAAMYGRFSYHEVVPSVALHGVIAVVNASFALDALAFVFPAHWWLAVSLVPPIVLILRAQRASDESQLRLKHMEFLYEASNMLHSSRDVAERYQDLLDLLQRMFHVSRAELGVVPRAGEECVRFISDEAGGARTVKGSLTDVEKDLLSHLDNASAVRTLTGDPVLATFGQERGYADGLVGVLEAGRKLGWVAVVGHKERSRKPSVPEEHLLATLAGLIGKELENEEISHAMQVLASEKAVLERKAFQDALTGLANRDLFEHILSAAVARFSRSRRPFAVAFMDLDGFKSVNDTYGHQAGDELLQVVAERITSQVRGSDTVARLGGDEFAVVVEDLADQRTIHRIASRIVTEVRKTIRLRRNAHAQIGVSVGIAFVGGENTTASAQGVLDSADAAMYEAKRGGKNRYILRKV